HFTMDTEGLSFPEAVRMLAEEIHLSYQWESSSEPPTEQQLEKQKMYAAHELASKYFHSVLMNTSAGKAAVEYLSGRGFSHKLIETFQIGYAPPMRDMLSQFLLKHDYAPDLMDKGGLLRYTDNGYTD